MSGIGTTLADPSEERTRYEDRCIADSELLLAALSLLTLISAPAHAGASLYESLELGSGGLPYAVHLPDGFDESKTYPVLVGPGNAEKDVDAGFYWKTDIYSHGWIIVDATDLE